MDSVKKLKNMIFENHAEPDKWFEVALNLERAAKILKENNPHQPHEIEYRYQEYMLWGFCIENLFKSILAAVDKNSLITFNETYKYTGPKHDLNDLAQKIDFSLTEGEKLLLKFLIQASLYLGRYPIPKNSSRLSAYWEDTFDKDLEQIIIRLKDKYERSLAR